MSNLAVSDERMFSRRQRSPRPSIRHTEQIFNTRASAGCLRRRGFSRCPRTRPSMRARSFLVLYWVMASALWFTMGCPQLLEDNFDLVVSDSGSGGGNAAADSGSNAGAAVIVPAAATEPDAGAIAAAEGDPATESDAAIEDAAAEAGIPPPPEACPGGSLGPDGETCYYVAPTAVRWSEARQACADAGRLLVQIDSADEDAFIASLGGFSFWIGAGDTVVEGSFIWSDGSAIVFSNWGLDQPDDFPGPDCIEKRQETNEPWYDQPCSNLRQYVCEAAAG
ncbi:MAG: C-type lectin domain-containing protein [Deltaproteobacteria bacterium]